MKSSDQKHEAHRDLPWSTGRKRLVSVLLALHLLAVFIAPWSAPPPAPLLARNLASVIRPYLTAAYLNHGYRFFAPNPGPSHIVKYEVTKADGSTVQGRVPDPKFHWPRLLYHRHFMMTETLFTTWSQIEPIPEDVEIPEPNRQVIDQRNEYANSLIQALSAGMATQLIKRFNGASVTLTLQEHAIPFPQDVLAGQRLDAPEMYVDLVELGSFPNAELPNP